MYQSPIKPPNNLGDAAPMRIIGDMASDQITRKKLGKSFSYFINDDRVTDKHTLTWIKSLAVPPAWQNVTISPDKQSKILARGVDKAGRTQSIYNPDFRAKQELKKYSKMLEFASHLPAVRKQVEKDIARRTFTKDKVAACAV